MPVHTFTTGYGCHTKMHKCTSVTVQMCAEVSWRCAPAFTWMFLQAALDRFAFMTPTTALGVLVALQPLALLKKHIQVLPLSSPYFAPCLAPCLKKHIQVLPLSSPCLAPVLPLVLPLSCPWSGPCLAPCCHYLAAIQCHQDFLLHASLCQR